MARGASTKSGTRKKSRARRSKAVPPGLCPLSGVPRGEMARAVWREVVDEALAGGLPCALALLDIDGFSRHNEELGVERADALLKAMVERARKALGDEAPMGRLAGDVFGVVLPGLEVEEALGRLEVVRRETVRGPFRVGRGVRKRQVEATFSFGLAGLHRDARTFRGLVNQARAALWRAKSLGGNRVGLPGKERMVLKTSYYPQGQLDQLKRLAQRNDIKEAVLLREALGDLFLKYKSRPPEA